METIRLISALKKLVETATDLMLEQDGYISNEWQIDDTNEFIEMLEKEMIERTEQNTIDNHYDNKTENILMQWEIAQRIEWR